MLQQFPLRGVFTRRRTLGIRATDMAKQLGVNRVTYHAYESGKQRIQLDKAITIANVLGVEDIRSLSEEPSEEEITALIRRASVEREARHVGADPWEAVKAAVRSGHIDKRFCRIPGENEGAAAVSRPNSSGEEAQQSSQQPGSVVDSQLTEQERIDAMLATWEDPPKK